jgi:hypothetical protein
MRSRAAGARCAPLLVGVHRAAQLSKHETHIQLVLFPLLMLYSFKQGCSRRHAVERLPVAPRSAALVWASVRSQPC